MNKLIRDNIPEIAAKDGKTIKFHIANEREYMEKLAEKLVEEAKELAEVLKVDDLPNAFIDFYGELADVMEVIDTIGHITGLDNTTLKYFIETKRAEKGGFNKKIIGEFEE